MILKGTTDGHATAAEISRTLLRGIVESAFNIKPDDASEAAQQKRKVDLAGFNNLRFIARISIEKSRDPKYDDKNKISAVTPDMKAWKAVEQLPVSTQTGSPGAAPAPATAPGKPAQAITRPEWAQGCFETNYFNEVKKVSNPTSTPLRPIPRVDGGSPTMTVDQATEADFRYFCDHPDEEQYIRQFVPGEFGKEELAPIPPGFRYATIVT
jgi:hypothetical protein